MKNRTSDPWRLVENNLGLVGAVINAFIEVDENRVGLEYADLYQEGCLWLYKAAISFDDSRNVKFSTYATKVVANGLRMYCRNLQSKNKISVLPFEYLDFEEKITTAVISSEELFNEYIEMMDILEWLELLKSEYKGVTKLGIEAIQWKVRGLRGSDIAKLYGVKPNHIGAWISKSLQKLRKNSIFNIYIEDLKNKKQ